MTEKRMLIVSSDLVKKIDENRGDLTQERFIDFLINSRLEQKSADERYVTKESIAEFEQDIRHLMRTFLDFFINYSLELGQRSDNNDLDSLTKKLQDLAAPLESKGSGKGSKG